MSLFGPNSVVHADELVISSAGEIRLVGVRVEFLPGQILDTTLLENAPLPSKKIVERLESLLPQTVISTSHLAVSEGEDPVPEDSSFCDVYMTDSSECCTTVMDDDVDMMDVC